MDGPRRSTWRCSRSIRSGIARIATPRPRSSRRTTRSSRNCAPRSPTASRPTRRWRCSTPDLAVEQLKHAVEKTWGCAARQSAAAFAARDFSEPRFHPVLGRLAEEAGRPCCSSHPQSTPGSGQAPQGQRPGWRTRSAIRSDTTIALQHLIFEGHARSLPPASRSSRRMAAAIFPSYAAALRPCLLRLRRRNCNPEIKLKKKPTEYLNQPSISMPWCSRPRGLRHLVAAGRARSQNSCSGKRPSDPLGAAPGGPHLSPPPRSPMKEKVAILGGNAARLFGMKA